MLVGYFSTSVERDSVAMQNNPYFVYDITVCEWRRRQVITRNGRVYLCCRRTSGRDVSGSTQCFEVVVKRELFYILVVYSSVREDCARTVFQVCGRVVAELNWSVHWLSKAKTIAAYQRTMAAVRANQNWTATHIAARIGLESYFELSGKVKVTKVDSQVLPDLLTPLHLAIKAGHLTIVQSLVAKHGASLEAVDVNGYSALHFGALSTPEVFAFLLSLPDTFHRLKAKTIKGCTPLHLACYGHKLENVFQLLRFGLSVSMLTLSPPHKVTVSVVKLEGEGHKVANAADNGHKTRDPIVHFTDKEIDELVIESIFYGGTPLHWTKTQSEVERFLEYGFPINGLNAKGETALILKTRRLRFKSFMSLLCQGADVNVEDSFGNNALYYAVRQGDVSMVQALVVFDCDIEHTNKAGQSIRHYAATYPRPTIGHQMCLYVLAAVGAHRCAATQFNCKDGCAHTGSYEGKRFCRWPVFSGHRFYEDPQLKRVVREAKMKLQFRGSSTAAATPPLANMVAFDGGGIKGLITIQMVHELQKRLKHNFVDYFEWSSGTSTGSIIAVALLFGMTTTQIRSIYFQFKDKVMTGSRPYASDMLEKLLKDEFSEGAVMGDFYTKQHKFLLIPTTLVDRTPSKMHLFRSYPQSETLMGVKPKVEDEDDGFKPFPTHTKQVVWEAVRSSCAAPTYFQCFNSTCIDGGLMANNPTTITLVEFYKYNYACASNAITSTAAQTKAKHSEVRKLNAVVSFGTGFVQSKPFTLPELNRFVSWNPMEMSSNVSYLKEMFNIILDSACGTNFHVVDRNETFCAKDQVAFFRLNPKLIEIMEMNETDDAVIVDCLWLTKVYMHSKKEAVDELCFFLENTWTPDEQRSKVARSHHKSPKTTRTKKSRNITHPTNESKKIDTLFPLK